MKETNHMLLHPENTKDPVKYDEAINEYSINVSFHTQQLIYFCPWCGEKLPPSFRTRWFEELEALGLDPMNDPIPDAYKTAEWRK